MSDAEGPTWTVALGQEGGNGVILRLDMRFPGEEEREAAPWLAILSWPFDADNNNGMPSHSEQAQMRTVETQLVGTLDGMANVHHVYTRTGNGLKEWVFYCADSEAFVATLQAALAGHPLYPFNISFFEDPDWEHLWSLQMGIQPDEGPVG